jgi:hypothetical protein
MSLYVFDHFPSELHLFILIAIDIVDELLGDVWEISFELLHVLPYQICAVGVIVGSYSSGSLHLGKQCDFSKLLAVL